MYIYICMYIDLTFLLPVGCSSGRSLQAGGGEYQGAVIRTLLAIFLQSSGLCLQYSCSHLDFAYNIHAVIRTLLAIFLQSSGLCSQYSCRHPDFAYNIPAVISFSLTAMILIES